MASIHGFIERLATHPSGIESAWIQMIGEQDRESAAQQIRDYLFTNFKPQSNPVKGSNPVVWRTRFVPLYTPLKISVEQSYELWEFFKPGNPLLVAQTTNKERILALMGQLQRELDELYDDLCRGT